ncbi:hypothetical protein L9F63_016463 [Diploptera punctata]|uniref:Ionotropic glutamate receptor C-terminal domain-containing protein n=1 Tax=Diploptera punctata TaxID=6984 RepID=A0AAD8A195_DIPPU|nr:hypothetical protein L9F63_016463 [Diploptera punctata]
MYIPFDSEFLVAQHQGEESVSLTEGYQINFNLPLKVDSFGSWTSAQGLKYPERSLYCRRNNLNGTAIRVGYYNDAATNIVSAEEGTRPHVGGYFGEVWSTLEERINFKSIYSENTDGAFGVVGDDGNWTGLMGMLIRNEVDIAMQSMTITSERYQFVDFTMPLIRSSTSIMIRKPSRRSFNWNNFLRPFSNELWLGVIICMIILTFSLSATFYLRRMYCADEEVEYDIMESFGYVYTSFCQQGCTNNPSAVSSRIVCMIIKLTATVLLSGYSAYLIANLAVHITVLPFTSLETLLRDRSYTLGLLANSYSVMVYKNTSDPVRQELYKQLVEPHTLPRTEYLAMKWICENSKYAFLGVHDTFFNQKCTFDCRIVAAWKSDWRNDLAMPVAKGNPYRGIIENT